MLARFPGSCIVCGGDIIPRQDEVEVHPTIRGPKGGKKVAHASCLTRSNPAAHRRARAQREPLAVRISVLKAPAGTSAWRTTYDALVPFEAASMAVQRVINQNSEAPKAREVTSAAQEVIDSLMEEGGSTSFELQRGGQSILVQVQREDRTLAQQGYVIPSVEARAAARAEQERAAKKGARRSYGRRRQLGL